MARGRNAGKRAKSRKAETVRKRYRRSAERLWKEAKEASGTKRERLELSARNMLQKTFDTYEKAPRGKVASLAREMGVEYKQQSAETRNQSIDLEASARYRVKDTQFRETMAKDILKTGNIGSRVLGGLSDVWKGEKTAEGIQEKIFDFLGVNSWEEVIDKIEEIAPNLYENSNDKDETYDDVTSRVMAYIKERQNETQV